MLAYQFQCQHSFESELIVFELCGELVLLQQYEQNDFHRNHRIPVANAVSAPNC